VSAEERSAGTVVCGGGAAWVGGAATWPVGASGGGSVAGGCVAGGCVVGGAVVGGVVVGAGLAPLVGVAVRSCQAFQVRSYIRTATEYCVPFASPVRVVLVAVVESCHVQRRVLLRL